MTFVARIADGVGLEAQGIDSSRARCRQSIASVHLCARNLESVQKKLLGRERRWQRHLARRSDDPAGGGSRDRPVAQVSWTATQNPLPPLFFG